MKNILITTSSFDLANFPQQDELSAKGFQVILNPYGKKMTEQQVTELIDETVVAMIAGTEPLTAAVLSKASALKVIVRCGIGMDNVDMKAAADLGIKVNNTPDGPTRSVAELTLAHILSLLRRVTESDRSIRNNKWQPLMGSLLYGQTVGVVGFGRIGKMVTALLSAFGARILVYDVLPVMGAEGVEYATLDRIFSESDIITLHVPYMEENHHLVNAAALAKMKPSAFLVNISRGGLVDDHALYEALTGKKIAGAALDCFEKEPYDGLLATLDNVQMSAHMGSYAAQARVKMEQDSCKVLLEELSAANII